MASFFFNVYISIEVCLRGKRERERERKTQKSREYRGQISIGRYLENLLLHRLFNEFPALHSSSCVMMMFSFFYFLLFLLFSDLIENLLSFSLSLLFLKEDLFSFFLTTCKIECDELRCLNFSLSSSF